jgi:hypothetical protein
VNFISNLSTRAKVLITAALAFVILIAIIGGSLYGWANGVNSDGVRKEAALNAQYQDNQNELSTYILKFNESLGIADRSSSKLDSIILDAVKGRYDNDTSLKPGTGGTMFSAITEAYPDLTATTESYAKVQDLVSTGRDAYKNKQSKLLDMLRDYDTWQNTGFIQRGMIHNLGFPSRNLTATKNGVTIHGEDALDQMRQIVLTSNARKAYDTGTMDPLLTPDSTSK